MQFCDTFLGEIIGVGQHLHVILSNPTKDGLSVVLTLIASFDGYQNDSCILRPSDGHSFIKHASYVSYESAVLYPISELEKLKNSGKIKPKESFSQAVMERILTAANKNSSRLSNACLKVLYEQKLIPH